MKNPRSQDSIGVKCIDGICNNVGWFVLKRFVDLIISRNHSSSFLLINLQKSKTCPK